MAKRNNYGDGGLFKRGDGMWVGTIEIPSADGKRKQKRVYSKTRVEAKRKRDEVRAEVALGIIPISSTTTVGGWLDYWLAEIKKPNVRPNTLDWYDEAVRLHIKPHVGRVKLKSLKAQDIRVMLGKVNTPGNAQRAHKTLKIALKDAMTEGLIRTNIAEAVDKPEHVKQARGSLTAVQAKVAIRAAISIQEGGGPRLATRWVAGFLTGARPAELLGLEWDRVDLDNGLLDLSWQLQQVDKAHGCGDKQNAGYPCGKRRASFCPQAHWDLPNKFEYRVCRGSLLWTKPKTDAGTRIVPIVAPLRVMLDQHQHRHNLDLNPYGLVWSRPGGNPLTRHDDGDRWREVLKAADLPTVDVYAIRHSTATLLQELGIGREVRMQIMGQSSAAAHDAYIHVDQTQTRAALGALESLLLGDSGTVEVQLNTAS